VLGRQPVVDRHHDAAQHVDVGLAARIAPVEVAEHHPATMDEVQPREGVALGPHRPVNAHRHVVAVRSGHHPVLAGHVGEVRHLGLGRLHEPGHRGTHGGEAVAREVGRLEPDEPVDLQRRQQLGIGLAFEPGGGHGYLVGRSEPP